MKEYTDEEFVRKTAEHIKKFSIRIGESIGNVRNSLVNYLTEMRGKHKDYIFKVNEVSPNLCKITLKLDKEYTIIYTINYKEEIP